MRKQNIANKIVSALNGLIELEMVDSIGERPLRYELSKKANEMFVWKAMFENVNAKTCDFQMFYS